MRSVTLTVGGTPIGRARTWAYPNGAGLGTFAIPTYRLTVMGTDNAGAFAKTTFPVFRFGVQSKDGRSAHVVGLAEAQVHVIKAWLPTYPVHSARSPEHGAWQVFGNFLIHDGPDDETELFASIGCIEIMGPRGFSKFNDLLIALMNPPGSHRAERLAAIGQSGRLKIVYEKSTRPPLRTAP